MLGGGGGGGRLVGFFNFCELLMWCTLRDVLNMFVGDTTQIALLF